MSGRLAARTFQFGAFALDVRAYELSRRGRRIRIEPRPLELLMLLVDRRGELVTRDDIVERLWDRDVFINVDTSVNTMVRKVRRALRDSANRPRFIETVPGKGYRFIADVESGNVIVLAVLPFENLQGKARYDYVADGLTEDTIAGLGQIDPQRLHVIGRTSSMAYRGTAKPLTEIGRELGADYVLEGSVRAAGRRCRIAARLIRVRDQMQIWTETYEREQGDLLGLQAELGSAIARQIELRLSPQRTAAATRRHTSNPDAYDAYLRGRYYYNQMTAATVARALECFGRATALDPGYALAWAGIAEAHTALARIQFLFDWDWAGAEATLRHALTLDPNAGQSYWMLGHAVSQQGRHDEALAAARRARELDPVDALTHSMSAQIAFSARNMEAAVQHSRNALLAEPDFWVGHWQLGQAYEQMGRTVEALEALGEATRLSNGNSKPMSVSAYTLAATGRVGEARAILGALERRSGESYVPPLAIALAYAGLKDRERVLQWLERALAVRDVHLTYVLMDPKWDPFRQDDRFVDLLRRGGLFPIEGAVGHGVA